MVVDEAFDEVQLKVKPAAIDEKLGGKGNIVILEGIPCTVNTARVDAAKEVFAMHPDIKIVGQDSGMWNRAKSLDVMQNILVKAPKIDAV